MIVVGLSHAKAAKTVVRLVNRVFKKGANLVEALSKVGVSRAASEFLGWGNKTTILKSASDFIKQQLVEAKKTLPTRGNLILNLLQGRIK